MTQTCAGILGSGLMGGKLGTIWARAGHDVITCSLPMNADDSGLVIAHTSSGPGPLRIARFTEPLTLLIAHLAYEGDDGPELAYRFERFGGKA